MEELLEEAARLLYDIENFGADDSERRKKVSLWLKKYESTQQSVPPIEIDNSAQHLAIYRGDHWKIISEEIRNQKNE